MENIIHYVVVYNQYLLKIIFDLLTFIARYIPLKQKIHDDSKSPKYQKFRVDRLPIIKRYFQQNNAEKEHDGESRGDDDPCHPRLSTGFTEPTHFAYSLKKNNNASPPPIKVNNSPFLADLSVFFHTNRSCHHDR
ncbi:MAG: hypothetical protein IJF67_18010 [Clostridia bacterium]|nr:hypothetical protein [Clostridia bacterium]